MYREMQNELDLENAAAAARRDDDQAMPQALQEGCTQGDDGGNVRPTCSSTEGLPSEGVGARGSKIAKTEPQTNVV